jgi:hypothetical protein
MSRDSAGIRIVESARPAVDPDQTWTVDSTLVSVGAADGPVGQQLDRVTAAVRLSDGTLIIANGGSRQLLRYDARGVYLGATGRQGEGPGEFRALGWVGRMRADSLATWDRGLDRITVFSPKGEYARDYRPKLTETPMSLEVKGVLSSGRLLLARGPSYIPMDGVAGVQRQPITGWIIDSTGVERWTVGPFPGETVFLEAGKTGGSIRTPIPFGASTLFAAGSNVIHVVDTDAFAIRSYSVDGTLASIAGRPHTPQPLQRGDVAAAIDARVQALPPVQEIRDVMRASFEKVPPPQNLPAVAALRVDSEGNVWAQAGHRPTAAAAQWSVFDRQGRWVTDVSLPTGIDILDIGDDYLIVRDRDELDVERVRVLRLHK